MPGLATEAGAVFDPHSLSRVQTSFGLIGRANSNSLLNPPWFWPLQLGSPRRSRRPGICLLRMAHLSSLVNPPPVCLSSLSTSTALVSNLGLADFAFHILSRAVSQTDFTDRVLESFCQENY